MKYILCDIDGCLYDLQHRLDFIMKGDLRTGWEKDTLIHAGQSIYAGLLRSPDFQVVFNTSRPESVRDITLKQLAAAFPAAKDFTLWMRPTTETGTPDPELKVAQVYAHGLTMDDIFLVFDDRNVICEAFRTYGVTAYQTDTGY
jgi:hypothetical protein